MKLLLILMAIGVILGLAFPPEPRIEYRKRQNRR